MRYLFLDPGDDKLIEISEMQTESGVAVALRTTGYSPDEDEVLEISVVDLSGNELFAKTVKPQNVETWAASEASGGITPADVENLPELYQFEEELSDLLGEAEIVIVQHLPFTRAMIEQSWVTLPDMNAFDVVEAFRLSHSSEDYRDEPAPAASLSEVASYYGLASGPGLADEARTLAAAYRALVGEHANERQAKGAGYWEQRDKLLADEAAKAEQMNEVMQKREKNFNRMNGLLWVAACLIFVSLVIQLYQRGADIGFMIVCGAFAVFALIRAIANFRR